MHNLRKRQLAKPYLFSICIFLSFHLNAQNAVLQNHALALKQTIASRHVSPKNIDDAFSAQWFDYYLELLDPERLYFTQEDIQKLHKFRHGLDDDFAGGKWEFFSAATSLYQQKLKASKTILETICAKPFDFTAAQLYNRSFDTTWAPTEKELSNRWQQSLKTAVLEGLVDDALHQVAIKGTVNRTAVLGKESDWRTAVKEAHLAELRELLEDPQLSNSFAALYLDAFALCHDPHSSFMRPEDKKDFETSLNTEAYFFGLLLMETDKGEVAIRSLVPGGSAWSSGLLHKDDVLLQIKWAGKMAVDLKGFSGPQVSSLLDGPETDKMELTVRKANGLKETVVLQKSKMDNEDNIVKGYLLKGNKNIGYISLPSFYTESEQATGSRCAADVAKEIVKLKKDSIAGLIIDLRYNGGGSLLEAVEMAGIFIDEGVMVQVKGKEEKPQVIKDMNRGVIYNGPLVLMVNGQSASASELLSAALQDYNRALIVGSATFGKGTGQEIMPVASTSGTVVQQSSNGAFVKVTTIKTFRPTGKSIQQTGVQPDILLPDAFEKFAEKESRMEYAITADTIAAYKYFKPMAPISKESLKAQSASRIKANPRFTAFTPTALSAEKPASLRWEDVEKKILESEKARKTSSQSATASKHFTPAVSTTDVRYTTNELGKEVNSRWLDRLGKDLYVEEAFLIISDLIKSIK